jgi:hypothetical protein
MVFSKVFSQNSYKDSLSKFIKDYISNHEVVTGEDRRHLHFYNIDEKFKIIAKFEKINNAPWFKMESTGLVKRMYRVYGKVHRGQCNYTFYLSIAGSDANG